MYRTGPEDAIKEISGARQSLTYRSAGVDIDAGERLVAAIRPHAQTTKRPGATADLGGFGGVFDLAASGFRDPLLVAATDGVGTKLRIAIETNRHDSIGIDLVAMCVNDLVVQGAEPLFFLDYLATGRLSTDQAESIVAGIARGCRMAGCALIGGETAEMPGMYRNDDYDLAGFAVGAVERSMLFDSTQAQAGDVVLGLASSGLHSNGFSLVRKVLERTGLPVAAPAPFASDAVLADYLLEPTRIYVASCLAATAGGGVRGLAHITGGGLIDNPPRAVPDSLTVRIDVARWPLPPVFGWLRQAGAMAPEELARTFNCGIGMMLFVAPEHRKRITAVLRDHGETVFRIGHLQRREDGMPPVMLENLEEWAG